MTLTDFLLARIAEDEEVARTFDAELVKEFGTTDSQLSSEIALGATGYMEYPALLIDSTRVLAECEAKRWIVEEHRTADYGSGIAACRTDERASPCRTLRLLALPYADHPDYRDEWSRA